MRRLRTVTHFLVGIALVFSLSACGLFGGDDGASLDGDLSWRVSGPEGISVQLTNSSWDGESWSGSSRTVSLSGGTATGDLEDGDYEGYQLQASGFGETPESLTLQLRNDGDVVEETSEPNENDIWMIEVGEMPSEEDFQ